MIETERLILRGYSDADREAFAAMNADPRIGEWLSGVLDREGSDALMDRINRHIAEHGYGFWGAEQKSDGRLIGFVGLEYVAVGELPAGPAIEIGWRLVPEVWGAGLASEGARAALAWGFANLDTPEIIAFTAETNVRSQAVMRRIGMRPEPWRDFDHPRLATDHPLRRHVTWSISRPN